MRNQSSNYEIISAGLSMFDQNHMVLVVKGNLSSQGNPVKILAGPNQPTLNIISAEPFSSSGGNIQDWVNVVSGIIQQFNGPKTVLTLPLPNGWYSHVSEGSGISGFDFGSFFGDFNIQNLVGTNLQRSIGNYDRGRGPSIAVPVDNTDTETESTVYDENGDRINGNSNSNSQNPGLNNEQDSGGMEWKSWYWVVLAVAVYLGYRKSVK